MTHNPPEVSIVEPSHIGERMQLELTLAKSELEGITPIVSIFGGARVSPSDEFYAKTAELALQLSDRGISVMSGGGPGVMEAANKGALAGAQGLSIGLNINLEFEQEPNEFQDIELNFDHFASRKAIFCKYASAFMVMPGGFGTLDELFEVLTLIQTKKSRRVPVVLYGREFWQGMIDWINSVMVSRGLVAVADMDLFAVVDTVEDAVKLCEEALTANPLAA